MPFCNLRNAVRVDIRSDLDAVSKRDERKKNKKSEINKNRCISSLRLLHTQRFGRRCCCSTQNPVTQTHAGRVHIDTAVVDARSNVVPIGCAAVCKQFWLKLRRKYYYYYISLYKSVCMHQLQHTRENRRHCTK